MNRTVEYTNYTYWMKRRHAYACGIELTPYCNFRCVHCYLQDGQYTSVMSSDEVKKVLDILCEEGVLFIYFTGGEILTRDDFEDIYIYAKKKGFIVELLTNGSLIDEKTIELFTKYPPAIISISVYGANEETYEKVTQSCGNYQKVMCALQLIAKAQLHFEIKFIGTKSNLGDFFKIEELARRYHVEFKHNFELFPALSGSMAPLDCALSCNDIIELEKKYEITARRWASRCIPSNRSINERLFCCDIAQSSFIIDCEGYMEPCNKLRLKKSKILDIGYRPIWAEYAKYKQMKAPKEFQCQSCSMRSVCTPCPAENLLTNGHFEIPAEHMCKLAKARMNEFSNSRYDEIRKSENAT